MKYELRKLKPSDAEDLAKVANNKNVVKFIRDKFPYPYKLKDAEKYIDYAIHRNDELIYGVVIEGKVCGCISAVFRRDVYRKSCELGYWLSEEYWGRGIMTTV